MRSLRTRTLALACALGLLTASCGGGGEPAAGALHLDLRLADGGSPSAALAAALSVEEIRPDADDPGSLGAWRIQAGRPTVSAGGGVRLLPRASEAPRFVRGEAFEAGDFTALEFVARTRTEANVVVAWRGSAGADRWVLPLHPGDGPRTLRFPLSAKRTWTGTIRELQVTPAEEPSVPVAVHAIRLLPSGFRWGHEPLEASNAGDAGLRAAGRFERRAWPADLDVPLFAEVAPAPRGAALAPAGAPGNNVLGAGRNVFAVVDARSGGGWREVARVEVPTQAARWTPLTVDLSDFAGDAVELRFRAHATAEGEVDADKAPTRECLLWGAPEVLGEPPASRRPNLVLVTLDTTRADALSEADAAFTPFLAKLTEESLVFDDAWSTSNATSPSHASLLTGLHVEEHGVVSNRHLLASDLTSIAEALRDLGYHTAAAVSAQHIQAGTGFGQGFDQFAQAPPGAELDGAMALHAVDRFLEEWRAQPPRPFFLWVHLFDPHTPYSPPEPFVEAFLDRTGLQRPPRKDDPATVPVYFEDTRTLEQIPPASRWHAGVTSLRSLRFSYHLGVAYADHLCERVYAALDGADLLDDTAFLLTADHGESLGEHNVWFDHAGLFRETLHVPLYLRLPDGADARRVSARSSGIDVVPTLRALAGLRPDPRLSGTDLRELAREDPDDRRVWFAFSDMHQVGFHDARAHFFTTLTDRLRYGTELVLEEGRAVPRKGDSIPKGKHFFYDPATDPALVEDVSAGRPDRVAASASELARWREGLERAAAQRRDVSAAEEQGLRDMGYAGD